MHSRSGITDGIGAWQKRHRRRPISQCRIGTKSAGWVRRAESGQQETSCIEMISFSGVPLRAQEPCQIADPMLSCFPLPDGGTHLDGLSYRPGSLRNTPLSPGSGWLSETAAPTRDERQDHLHERSCRAAQLKNRKSSVLLNGKRSVPAVCEMPRYPRSALWTCFG